MTVRRVLVTRPEPDASRTADKLAERGFEPVLLPLTRITPLDAKTWAPAEGFRAVAVSSANAVRHAPPALLAGIAHLPVFAVGERTGEAAREAGLRVVDAEAGDAGRLVQRVAGAIAPGAHVLLLCGRVRRDSLEQGLMRSGIHTVPVETYDTIAFSPSEREVVGALGGVSVDAVLLYSALAAEMFARIAGCGLFGETAYFAISERVAKMLPDAATDRLRIAQEPTEEAMLSMLSA